MSSLLKTLVKYAHILIILKVGFDVFGKFEEHEEIMKTLKSQKPALINQKKTMQKKLELAKTFQENLEESKERVRQVAEQIEKVKKQLPNTISDTAILDYFNNEAELMNIKNIYLSPMAEEENGFYFSKKYEFKGKATFLQLLVFFERISQSERLLNVKTLDMKTIDDRQKGRFKTGRL